MDDGWLHGGGAWIVHATPYSQVRAHPGSEVNLCHSFTCAMFLAKRGQCGSRESCILLENKPTQVSPGLCSVFVACSVWISYCKQRTLWTKLLPVCEPCCQMQWRLKLIGMIIAAGYMSSNYEFWSHHVRTVWWAVTWRTSKNHTTVQIEGWALAQGWALT